MLMPWFVPFDQTREDMYLELCERLTHKPDETFVCVAIQNDLIKGMTIAYTRDSDVFIWQASTQLDVPARIVDVAFDGICHWARSKGFNRISGLPNRARHLWERRWGFKQSLRYEDEVCKEI